jgi:hypothetical protein
VRAFVRIFKAAGLNQITFTFVTTSKLKNVVPIVIQ